MHKFAEFDYLKIQKLCLTKKERGPIKRQMIGLRFFKFKIDKGLTPRIYKELCKATRREHQLQ